MQSSLPDDHYRYIVCHVQDRQDLLSLRLTSRALGYEATKVLYRTVEIKAFNQSVVPLLSYLSKNHRTAAHVEIFSITFEPPVTFWGSSWLIRGFLRKAHNLKELCILTTGDPFVGMMLDKITEGVKFNLRHLRWDLPASERSSRFLQSQPGIVDLSWLSDSGPIVTFSHLPNLITLETGKNDDFLMGLLPGSKVVRLKYGRIKRPRGIFETIEVLTVHPWRVISEEELSRPFPNLRYLSALFYSPQRALHLIRPLVKLQKLVLYLIVIFGLEPQDTGFATELFSSHPVLHHIDLCVGDRFWKIERGPDNTPTQIEQPRSLLDPDEWKSW